MALRDFTDEDMRKIQNLLDQESRRVNGSYRPEDPSYIDKSPDVYVAKTPSAGIPARSGTSLGHALCEIYKAEEPSFGSNDRDLQAVLDPDGYPFELRVYNIFDVVIEVEYIKIKREKYGNWIAEDPC